MKNLILILKIHLVKLFQKKKLFGQHFVENNKEKCKIIINNKEYELYSYINLEKFCNNNDQIEIKLKGVSNITNMSFMFCGCLSLLSLPDFSKIEINNVKDMSHMFQGCHLLSPLPDISKWNTKNVINMSYLFNGCTALKTLPDISKWNLINVIEISYMFEGCSSLLSLPDISKWKLIN